MRIWTTFILAATVLTSLGQNNRPTELGIGFAVATNPFQFEDMSHYNSFYVDENLKAKWTGTEIFPFFYKPDYGLYHFICIEKTDDFFKILINDTSTAFIPNDTNFVFKNWDTMLLEASVQRLTKDNPIRATLDDKNEIIENTCEHEILDVLKVLEKDGQYWLYVSFSPDCETYPDDKSNLKYGWIKWRTKSELLVDIILLC